MITEEELEQRTNDMIDQERIKQALLSLEIQQMNEAINKTKAVGNIENVSGLSKGSK